jgi:hypothetical protein
MQANKPDRRQFLATLASGLAVTGQSIQAAEPKTYQNELKPVRVGKSILNDFPHYVEPIRCETRFEAPPIIDEPGADLSVRAWRWSYNARGIIEIPNRLRSDHTAVIVVHHTTERIAAGVLVPISTRTKGTNEINC